MKKMTVVAVALLMCAAVNGFGAEIDWQTDSSATSGILGPNGTWDEATMSTWQIRLYSDVDGVLPASSASSFDPLTWQPISGGTMLNATTHASDLGGTFSFGYVYETAYTDSGLGLGTGSHIYSVMWDSATVGTATHFVIIDATDQGGGVYGGSTFTIPNYGNDVAFPYDMGQTAAGGVDWVAVPEPGTLALFGLGLAVLAARRTKKNC